MSTQDPTLSRRTLLKTGAGAVAGGTLATGLGTDRSLVGESDALLPALAVGGGAALVAAGTGWVLRDQEVIGKDDPPEGLTPETLKQQVYSAAKKRKSVNASTFVDNQNILNYLPEAAFSEAKTAALEALNDQKTQSEVQAAGEDAANAHFTTIEKNLLDSWSEASREFGNMVATINTHTDVTRENLIKVPIIDYDSADATIERDDHITTTQTVSLRDGTSYEITSPAVDSKVSESVNHTTYETVITWNPTQIVADTTDGYKPVDWETHVEVTHDSTMSYLKYDDWNAVWSDMQSTFDQVLSDLSLWVDNIYGQVQSGAIDTSQVISGVDLANMTDDSVPQAVADLAALNIPADLDNQATVELDDGTIMAGFLAFTDSAATDGLAPGDSLDPSAVSGDVYMAHDLAEWSVPWTDWDSNKGIDGGLLHLTADPTVVDGQPVNDPSVLIYTVATTDGESAAVPASDFSQTTNSSGTTVWEIDLSSKLDNAITSVESITVTLDMQSQYATTQINQPFTVTETQSGDPVEPGQSREPQDDTNYITQDEWDELLKQQEVLIDKYEEAKAGGGAGGFSLPSFSQVPENAWMWLVGGIAALAGINAATS
ncbi:twin-arginine translocation signal domain-containing protein [Halapricum desulfuricans]|uniref:Envelope protein N-terminal domain-containing protein n=1 Tax=Halapricum desulfuricans TaxID=2841257 RepID=A0A897N073_9EURY|nr:twin-arginine translocation signal domain-containing protein [Halapricum desulfuricans]QSG06084.1 Uncharacterized protein HSR121_1749 [Halapricum desulfuricans]